MTVSFFMCFLLEIAGVYYILSHSKGRCSWNPKIVENSSPQLRLCLSPFPCWDRGRGAQTTTAAPKGMFVSIHQASTARFDFKASCEGISKAGVRAVEVDIAKIQQFAQTESLPKAKQFSTTSDSEPVSASNHLGFVDASAQQFQGLMDQLKTKLEVVQAVGGDRIVCPSTSIARRRRTISSAAPRTWSRAAELAKTYGVTLMLEFAKTSRLANSIQTALQIIREANHPNARVMLDTFHFYGGRRARWKILSC